jgi:hypothetical protein
MPACERQAIESSRTYADSVMACAGSGPDMTGMQVAVITYLDDDIVVVEDLQQSRPQLLGTWAGFDPAHFRSSSSRTCRPRYKACTTTKARVSPIEPNTLKFTQVSVGK